MSLGSDDVTMGHLSLRDPMKAEGGHKEDKKVKNGNSITYQKFYTNNLIETVANFLVLERHF